MSAVPPAPARAYNNRPRARPRVTRLPRLLSSPRTPRSPFTHSHIRTHLDSPRTPNQPRIALIPPHALPALQSFAPAPAPRPRPRRLRPAHLITDRARPRMSQLPRPLSAFPRSPSAHSHIHTHLHSKTTPKSAPNRPHPAPRSFPRCRFSRLSRPSPPFSAPASPPP